MTDGDATETRVGVKIFKLLATYCHVLWTEFVGETFYFRSLYFVLQFVFVTFTGDEAYD